MIRPAVLQDAGVVSHIMHFALHDGPGIRTTVFLKGCPLSCWWCHNPETQEYDASILVSEDRCRRCGACIDACTPGALAWVSDRPVTVGDCDRCGACAEACVAEARILVGRRMTVADVMAEIVDDVVFFEESDGGVTLSGGEPLAQPRFTSLLLDACRARGIHTVLDTSGYAPRAVLLRTAGKADLLYYDIKFVNAAKHRQYTGVANRRILDNLRALLELQRPLVVRVPVIPGINDTPADIRELRAFLDSLPPVRVDLLPYHPTGTAKYRRLGWDYRLPELSPPTAAHMSGLAAALMQPGRPITIGGPP